MPLTPGDAGGQRCGGEGPEDGSGGTQSFREAWQSSVALGAYRVGRTDRPLEAHAECPIQRHCPVPLHPFYIFDAEPGPSPEVPEPPGPFQAVLALTTGCCVLGLSVAGGAKRWGLSTKQSNERLWGFFLEAARTLPDQANVFHALWGTLVKQPMGVQRSSAVEEACRAGLALYGGGSEGGGGVGGGGGSWAPAYSPCCHIFGWALGEVLEAQGQYGAAAAAYAASGREIPPQGHPLASNPADWITPAVVLNADGLALKRHGDLPQALEVYPRALCLAPRGSPTMRLIEENMESARQFEQYRNSLQSSLQMPPNVSVSVHAQYRGGFQTYGKPSEQQTSLKRCTNCGAMGEKLLHCGRCHGPVYCGPECQKRDWKAQHKRECQPRG